METNRIEIEQAVIIATLRRMAAAEDAEGKAEWGRLVVRLAEAVRSGPSPWARQQAALEEARLARITGAPVSGDAMKYL